MNLRARVYSPESQCGNLGEFFWNEHLTYIHMKAEINILKNAVGMNHSDTGEHMNIGGCFCYN